MQKLITFLDAQPLGYKGQLAEALGRAPSYLSRQLAGDRSFTERDAIGIEKYTGGQVRCEDVLPDVDWAVLRDGPNPSAEGPPSKIPGPVEEGGRPSSLCSDDSGGAHVAAEIGGGA